VIAEIAQRELQISAWSNALAADSESAISLAQLAGLHLQRARESGSEGDYHKAEDYARRSLALRVTRNGRTYLTLATALVASHRFAEAEQVAREAVELEPDVPEYAAALAEIRMELGDYTGARILFDSLFRFQSRLSIAPRLSRWAELDGRSEVAYRILRKAAERAAERRDLPREQVAWFHYRLGDFEARHGRMYRARKEYEKGLAVAPDDHRILTALAKLALMEDRPQRAIEDAERALSARMDPATLAIMAEAHLALGDTVTADENISAMEIAVRGQPGEYHRAWSLFLLDHGREAGAVHARAVEELKSRKDIYGYDVLAWSLYHLGRFDDAALNMTNALKLGTRDPLLLYHAGMIQNARDDRDSARQFLEAALAINDRFDTRHADIARTTLEKLR
jgi:tetratricopeptide (TPR) repeat protein